MVFTVPIDIARTAFPQYTFINALTPSAQKAAFHVRDEEGNDLCLKIIAPNYSVDRLSREILALQSISHPNVAKLKEYTFSSSEGHERHYLVEEFVPGKDLSEDLQPGHRWSTSNAITFFTQLCDGLSALREAELVHRDLKPSNIRIRSDNSPVIIDFGLVRCLALTDLTSTSEGAAIGTPAYFAPEQWRGTKHDIDHRTDLFALGILLYQAIIGSHPFLDEGMSARELHDVVCTSEDCFTVQEFTSLPEQLKLIMRRLLEKERARRPHGAAQVATILRRLGEN